MKRQLGSRIRFRNLRSLAALVVAAAAMVVAQAAGLGASLDQRATEWRASLDERQPTGRIVLVDIDARSLAEIGIWPWPRRLYGDLLRSAASAGAARVAFDIDFSTRSNAQDDAAFAEALSEAGVDTVLAAFVQADTASGHGTVVSLPTESLLTASWPGSVNVHLDADQRVRRLPADIQSNGETITAMPALLADRAPATGHDGIDFSIAANRIAHVSFTDLLHGRVAPQALKGKTLLVGASAVELRDLFAIPVHGTVSGASVLALSTETLLQNRELRTVALPTWLVAVLGLAGLLIVTRLRPQAIVLGAVGGGLVVEALGVLLQARFAIVAATGAVHVLLAGLVIAALLRAFDLRRALLWLAEARGRNQQSLIERVLDDGFDGIVVVDDALRVMRINGEASRLLGLATDAAPGAADDLPGTIAADIRSTTEAFKASGDVQRVLRCVTLEARGCILEYSIAPFWMTQLDGREPGDDDVACACLTLRDVTEREQGNERVRFLALHDSLTGLGNRHALDQWFNDLESASGTSSHALLSFDLDRFKSVNDTLGHGIGDRILAQAAERARAVLGQAGSIARLGGDEYAMLMPATEPAEAQRKGQDLVAALEQPFWIDGHRIALGASVGIACWTSGEETASSAMRHADVALHRAKRSSMRKVAVFEPSMDADRRARLEIERDMMRALEAGEFCLAYQPQVRLRTGDVVGAEALLRWRHPEKGFISPATFIPVAEEMGLIHRLGAFAMTEACREAASWPSPIKVAVNVSALQISAGNLLATVEQALAASSLATERLELEITESAFVDDNADLKDTFDALEALGIRFALDDFGTGYSSLGYLHRFPISKIKIDRSFVTGVPRVGSSMAVLRSVMALAGGLGIRTIAEGIETIEEANTLDILGCDDGQGFLYARPLSAEDLATWLQARGERAWTPMVSSTAA